MARFENGWFRVERRCALGDIGQKGDEMLGFWVRLLSMANVYPSQILWRGEPRVLDPGQVLTGLPELAGTDRQSDILKVRRKLDFLEKRQSIRQEVGNRGRIITICNWEKYRLNGNGGDMQTTDKTTVSHEISDSLATVQRHLIEQRNKETIRNKILGDAARENPGNVDNSQNAVDNSVIQPASCRLCSDTGKVSPRDRNTGVQYAMRCSCARGRAVSSALPFWSPDLEDAYELAGGAA